MLFLGIYKDTDGKEKSNLYYNWRDWFCDTFSPTTKIVNMILFKISGKTYEEKQNNLRQLAIDFQTCEACGLSYGEFCDICNFFEKNAKRYGLIKEFKENCII